MKKIMAMLLSIVMLASVPFTTPAARAANGGDIAARRDKNIHLFFEAFPVITEEMTEDNTITRAEFACVIKNILERADIMLYDGTAKFGDVDENTEYAAEIKTVTALGYMTGKTGKFRPEDPITDTEAAEAIIHLLNVDYNLGVAADITSGIWSMVSKAGIDISRFSGRKNAAWIKRFVYKALQGYIGTTTGTSHGVPQMAIDRTTTYMEEYWGLKKVEGLLSANSILEVNGKNAAGDNMVTIDGENYVSYLVYENNAYIGQYVTAFVYDKGINDNSIMCMFPNELYDPSVTLLGRDIDTLTSLSRITAYDENGKKKSYAVSSLANVYFNFEYMGPVRALDYESDRVKAMMDAVLNKSTCEIILKHSDRSGDYDFVWVRVFENYAVSKFSYEEYTVQDKFGVKLDMAEAFRLNNIVMFDNEGRLASAVGIAENDILSLMVSRGHGGDIDKAVGYYSDATVSGTMTSVNADECIIDGDTYYISDRYRALADANDKNVLVLKPGLTTTFYLNVFNEISAVSFNDHYKEGETYAFVINVFYDEDEEKTTLRLLNEDGSVTREELKRDIVVNGTKYSNKGIITAMSKISGEHIVDGGCDVYRLARITRIGDIIKKIELALREVRPDGTPVDDLYPDQILYSRGNNTDGTAVTLADVVYKSNTFGKRVGITTSTVVFDVPIKGKDAMRVTDDDAYTITSVSNMQDDCVLGLGGVKKVGDDGKGAYMEFFDTDNTLFASAAVRYYSYDSKVGGIASPPEMLADCLIVSKVYKDAVNDEGENIIIIEGYRAGAKVSYETAPIRDYSNPWGQFMTLADPTNGARLEKAGGAVIGPETIASTGVLPGDVLQLTFDNKNRISNMLINVRGASKANAAWLMTNGNGTTTSILSAGAGHGNEYLGVNYGEVTEIQNGKVVLKELDGKLRVYSIGSPTITVYNRSVKKNPVRKGGTDDIEIGKDIYIRQYYSQVKEIVVFEE